MVKYSTLFTALSLLAASNTMHCLHNALASVKALAQKQLPMASRTLHTKTSGKFPYNYQETLKGKFSRVGRVYLVSDNAGTITIQPNTHKNLAEDDLHIVCTIQATHPDLMQDWQCKRRLSSNQVILKNQTPELFSMPPVGTMAFELLSGRAIITEISHNLNTLINDFMPAFTTSFEIYAPTKCRVAVKTQGPITASYMRGNMQLHTRKYPVTVKNCRNCMVETDQGTITILNSRGNVLTATQSGDIQLRNIKGHIDALSASGNIDIDHAQRSVTAQTTQGNIVLTNVDANQLNAQSTSGTVSIN